MGKQQNLSEKHPDFIRFAVYATSGAYYELKKSRCIRAFNCNPDCSDYETVKQEAILFASALSWKNEKHYLVYCETMRYGRPKYHYQEYETLTVQAYRTLPKGLEQNFSHLTHQGPRPAEVEHQDFILKIEDLDQIMRPVSSKCCSSYRGEESCLWVGRNRLGDYVWVLGSVWTLRVPFIDGIGFDVDEETWGDPNFWYYQQINSCFLTEKK